MPELIGLLIVGVLVWLVVHMVNQNTASHSLDRRERAQLQSLKGLVDDLKETAWDHRELDSALATIIIDKIRTYERQERERGS